MKKIAFFLLIVAALSMVVRTASAVSRTNPILPPPNPNPVPLVSAN